MALSHAILAALIDGESSGYDLAKSFDVGVANFWSATPQQLYRELDKLESEGLVQARLVQQERRPNKRLFTITDAGRTAVEGFIATPPKPTAIRDELLVQVESMRRSDTAAIREKVAHQRALSQHKLERYLEARETMLRGRDEAQYFARSRRVGPYLTLARGIAFEEGNVRWCDDVLAALDAVDAAPRVR